MSSDLSKAQLERAKRVILQYPEVHRYSWHDDSLHEAEPASKRSKVASYTEEAINASAENVDIVARLIEFLSKWQALSPSAKTRVANIRVRTVRNLVRREHSVPDKAVQELHQQIFCKNGARGCFIDDAHVVFAGLELKLLTADVIREYGREAQERRQQAKEDVLVVKFHEVSFSPGFEAKHAMADLFWEGRDFEWVVPDGSLNDYWKTVNKRVRCIKAGSFARQKLHLTDNAALLKKLLHSFGPEQVFIPETARICLATCAMSLIQQRDFRRNRESETDESSSHAQAAVPASDTKGHPNGQGGLESFTTTSEVLKLIAPDSEATWRLPGYEESMHQRDVLEAFFDPELMAKPLDEHVKQKHGTESLYEDLRTIFLPLMVETGSADDTSPDMSEVIAILVANPCFDILPPVIFIDDRFTLEANNKHSYIGSPLRKFTRTQMAPVRKWVKYAYLGCSIFQKWCTAHSVALDCKFADEHPIIGAFGGS